VISAADSSAAARFSNAARSERKDASRDSTVARSESMVLFESFDSIEPLVADASRAAVASAFAFFFLSRSSSSSSSSSKRSASPSFAALAPSFGNQRGADAAAAAATRRAHETSSFAGGPMRPPHALKDSNAAAISVHGCRAAAGDAPGISHAMASHSASRQKQRTSASAPASGGGLEPSAAARRSSLLSDRFFAFLSLENSLCGTYARSGAAFGPVPNASGGATGAGGGSAARHATLARTSAARARRSVSYASFVIRPPPHALALSMLSFSASACLRAGRCTAPASAAVASVTAASITADGSSAEEPSAPAVMVAAARSSAAPGHAPSWFSSKLAHAAAARSTAARAWWSAAGVGSAPTFEKYFAASWSSAGNATVVAARRKPSTTSALRFGWMERFFETASSGSTARMETIHASPATPRSASPTGHSATAPVAASVDERTSGCRDATTRAAVGARVVVCPV